MAESGMKVNDVLMPGGIYFRATYGRAIDNDGNIHIEGPVAVLGYEVPGDA